MTDERRTANNERQSIPSSVELYIEELVLRGFAPGNRYSIGEAMECELSRLLAEQGMSPLLTKGAAMARLDCGSFHMSPGANAEAVGVQVAQAIGGGLTK